MTMMTTNSQCILDAKILSELYIALLGEECMFVAIKVSGQEFKVLEDSLKELPPKMIMMIEKIAEISTFVRFIEQIKRRKHSESVGSDDSSPVFELPEARSGAALLAQSDAIKKAILESLFSDFDVYLKSTDQMRIKNISTRSNSNDIHKSIDEALNFALIWHKRLRFVKDFINTLIEAKNGMELMNVLYDDLSNSCSKDWRSGFLQRALYQGSKALCSICTNWLMDGHLEVGGTKWMVTRAEHGALTRLNSSNSNSLLGNSFNSLTVQQLELTPPQPQNLLMKFEQGSSAKRLHHQGDQVDQHQQMEPLLTVPFKFDKDDELVPAAIRQNAELVGLILEIGKKVHALKVLRSARTYEHRIGERRELLERGMQPEIWCGPPNRQTPLLVAALNQLYQIVNEDMAQELKKRQRLVDHLALVHTYFFMLRGDLFAELERIIQISFIRTTLYYQTPISVRKRSSNSSKMTELLMNEALDSCAPPPAIADLMPLLSTDKASRDRSRTFFESFGLTYDPKGRRKGGGKGTNTNASAALLQQQQRAMGQVFSKEVLKIYKRIFGMIANIQILRFQVAEIGHRFTHDTCHKLRKRIGGDSSSHWTTTSIHFALHRVRLFLSRLANYIFEDVLLLESKAILGVVQTDANFHRILEHHSSLLNRTVRALCITRDSSSLFEAIMATIKAARNLVNSVEELCNAVDAEQLPTSPAYVVKRSPLEMDNRRPHEPVKLGASLGGRKKNGAMNTPYRRDSDDATQTRLDNRQFVLHECAAQFKKCQTKMGTILTHALDQHQDGGGGSRRQMSIYWPKLRVLLCD